MGKVAIQERENARLQDNWLIQLQPVNERLPDVRKGPQATQKDRAEILRALPVANGRKMLAKDARKKMHLSKERFSTCFDLWLH